MSDDVDLVYIADCNYEGKDHLRFATPGLEKGVPHFVDKPFAYTLGDARAMIALAKKHETALMCCSLLRQSPHLERFRDRLKDIAPVGSILVPSYGPSLACLFHAVSAVQNVLGEGCEWVESMGPELYDVLRLYYPKIGTVPSNTKMGTVPSERSQTGLSPFSNSGIDAIVFSAVGHAPGHAVNATNYNHCGYYVSAYGAGGSVHSPRVDDYQFPYAGMRIVTMAKSMAKTGKPPIPYESTLELMAMIEAARLAHNKGKRVYLKEVRA